MTPASLQFDFHSILILTSFVGNLLFKLS